MRHLISLISLLVILALLVTTQLAALDVEASSKTQDGSTPKVTGVRVKGKKLWVFGENFSESSEILINGEPVGTTPDSNDPAHILFAKKGGKRIPSGANVALSVRSGQVTSGAFEFFSGLTIMLDDDGRTFTLKAGEKFELLLKTTIYDWVVSDFDANLVSKQNDPVVADAQGIFLALKPGTTRLRAQGQLPCHKLSPPCLAPSPLFEVTLIIE